MDTEACGREESSGMKFPRVTRWRLLAAFALLAALAAALYPAFRAWRAGQLAREADRLAESPEMVLRAWDRIQAAHQLAPDDIAIARRRARICGRVDPGGAARYWREVVAMAGSEPRDRLAWARALLRAERWPELEEQLAKLEGAAAGIRRQAAIVRAKSRIARNRVGEARNVLERLLQREDAPPEARLLYVRLTRARDAGPDARRKGIETLVAMVEEGGEATHRALEGLARLDGVRRADARAAREAFGALTAPSRELRLAMLALELEFGLRPADAVGERAAALFDRADPNELAELGRWLNQRGLAKRVLGVIPEKRATQRQDLFLIHADALARLDRWDAVERLLRENRVPLDRFSRQFFLLRVHLATGRDRSASLAFDRAVLEARKDPLKLLYLRKKLRLLGETEMEAKVLREMTGLLRTRRRAYQELARLYERTGRIDRLVETLRDAREAFPDSPEIRSDLLYFGFLRGDAPNDALEEARKLFEARPETLAYRMTYALGLLRAERVGEAVRLIDGLPVNWFEVRPRWRLIAAAALAGEGYAGAARKFLETIAAEDLLGPEREWLARARREASAAAEDA